MNRQKRQAGAYLRKKVASLCFGKPKPTRSLLPMVAD